MLALDDGLLLGGGDVFALRLVVGEGGDGFLGCGVLGHERCWGKSGARFTKCRRWGIVVITSVW